MVFKNIDVIFILYALFFVLDILVIQFFFLILFDLFSNWGNLFYLCFILSFSSLTCEMIWCCFWTVNLFVYILGFFWFGIFATSLIDSHGLQHHCYNVLSLVSSCLVLSLLSLHQSLTSKSLHSFLQLLFWHNLKSTIPNFFRHLFSDHTGPWYPDFS